MRHHAPNLTVAFLAVLALFGCGGGGGGGGNTTTNNPPTANAGPNQTVASAATVTLSGSASTDSDGTIASYAWTQTAGLPAVSLSGATTAQPTFVAPSVIAVATYTFSLVVTDNRGASSTASTITVTVNPPVVVNQPPTANAGTSQTVASSAIVTLNGAGSLDPDGTIATYAWTQTAGTAVTLSNAAVAQPTFTAPTVVSATALTFSLTVTDNSGAASAAATVTITVNPPVAGNVNVTGNVTFTRIPTTAANGLNYAAPLTQAARGVTVRALAAGTSTILAAAATSDTGAYTLSVPGNTSIDIVVVALMQRTGSLPNWNFRVQDGTSGNTPYTSTDGSFNSGAGTTHNLQIPSGFNAAGAVTGTRASAPFAVLDTVYQAVQTILGVAPTTNFPTLVLDWATNNPGGQTFFSSTDPNNVPLQNIVLSADITEDTDEFDQHVIAHEFGHYIEFNFSRADNIGGSHGLGDKLDIRVAFGEGFGYAFAAIVLNDPDARDTFVLTNGTRVTSRFDIEANPSTSPAGANPAGNYGCWCSESSVWAILWDIYDSAADTNDNVALGFGPMWSVLTTTQKTTPAVTSIFSFITALKAANAGQATAINTLILAQNIDTNIDAFGSTETHRPNEVTALGALPVFTNATIGGGSVIVQSVNDTGGTYNNLGNHRFVKFDVVGATRVVTITVSSANPTNPDPDFVLYRAGSVVAFGQSAPAPTETKSNISLTAATYVLDVYECANGCSGTGNGTAGSYAMTVTVN